VAPPRGAWNGFNSDSGNPSSPRPCPAPARSSTQTSFKPTRLLLPSPPNRPKPSNPTLRAAAMGGAADLVLKAACDACGKASELYSTACRHATLCNSCAATM
uniref:Uncharacterized protein n=1 Tax=Aegilops tauschii subsp. strangulata TaxID=200361 RepID=A0A453IHM5_AEGTS